MRKIYFLVIFVFTSTLLFAQNTEQKLKKDLYKKVNKHMYNESYFDAQQNYLKILEIAPNKDMRLFGTGLSYFFSSLNRNESLTYFEMVKSVSRTDTLTELDYYLGRGNQLTSNFEVAVQHYENIPKQSNKKTVF